MIYSELHHTIVGIGIGCFVGALFGLLASGLSDYEQRVKQIQICFGLCCLGVLILFTNQYIK